MFLKNLKKKKKKLKHFLKLFHFFKYDAKLFGFIIDFNLKVWFIKKKFVI